MRFHSHLKSVLKIDIKGLKSKPSHDGFTTGSENLKIKSDKQTFHLLVGPYEVDLDKKVSPFLLKTMKALLHLCNPFFVGVERSSRDFK